MGDMAMECIEIKASTLSEENSSMLHRFLAAHLALERTVARRRFFVHLSAFFAVPVWLVSAVSGLREFKLLALGSFALLVFVTAVSLVLEMRCLSALRSLEKEAGGALITHLEEEGKH